MDGATTAQSDSAAKSSPKPKRGRRTIKVLVLTMFLFVGIYTGLVVQTRISNQLHPLYDQALQEVRASDIVKNELGDDIEGATPDRSVVNDSEAEFEFFVEGPHGIATVQTKGRKVGGDWVPTALNVEFLDGHQHDLLR